LGYLHSHPNEYAHRNVKPESILLDELNNVKISGFDFSKEQFNEYSQGNTNIGTRNYFSPEMKKNPPIPYDK
jgi:serine/threonine protein kinase